MNERSFRKTFCHMFFLKQSKYNESFSFFEYIVTSAETEKLLNSFHRPKARYREEELGLRIIRELFL